MNVVSNTTPISELYKIDHLELLALVYGQILIPEAVAQELASTRTWAGLSQVAEQTPWISVLTLTDAEAPQRLRSRYSGVHEGEAATMVLAREIQASRIILDDKRARQVAHGEGLPVIGTVGVVLLAHRLGCLSALQGQRILEHLYQGTAYISEGLYRDALRQLLG